MNLNLKIKKEEFLRLILRIVSEHYSVASEAARERE